MARLASVHGATFVGQRALTRPSLRASPLQKAESIFISILQATDSKRVDKADSNDLNGMRGAFSQTQPCALLSHFAFGRYKLLCAGPLDNAGVARHRRTGRYEVGQGPAHAPDPLS